LRSEDVAKRATALANLEKLRGDQKLRVPATRALIVDGAAHRSNTEKLLALARDLQSYPEAVFNDRVIYVEMLRQLHDPKFTEYLTKVEDEAKSNPVDLASLVTWMKVSGMSVLAIDFVRTVPNEIAKKWPVPLAVAGACASAHDWGKLKKWAQIDWEYGFLRHAYLALALRNEEESAAAASEWTAARKEAGSRVELVSILLRTVSEWGWQNEAVELLWTLTKYPETQIEALHELYQRYVKSGDTLGLYRVLVRLVEVTPGDMVIQNNLAQVSLLLGADLDRARRLAADLYHKDKSNATWASTYAFGLYTQGDFNGALKVLDSLSDDQLREPSLAAYYGVILAASGSRQKAREYFKLSASAKLLPEEKELIAKAQSSLK
jgi:hypothetical protein